MYSQRSTIQRLGVAVILAVCLALPASVWAAPPSSNPGQPFGEILEAIRGVTQNWDKKLDATNGEADGCNSERFTCVLDEQAVRDNETGLVWDRNPDSDTPSWFLAISNCANREVGGRKGFHLPLMEQLASLVDTSGTGVDDSGDPVKLPDGHPFKNVQSNFYWSATTGLQFPELAEVVTFFNGEVSSAPKFVNFDLHAWCVRGGQSFDGNTHEGLQ
jgi:hypothetical protein